MKPVTIQNELITVSPILGNTSEKEVSQLMLGVTKIFADTKVTAHYPEKRFKSSKDTERWFDNTLNGYSLGTSFNHFIRLRSTGEVIGIIEVTTSKALEKMPARAGLFIHYPELKGCIEVEYWLNSAYWNQGIMSGVLGAFTKVALEQGIPAITAFVLADNGPSKSVLINSGFAKVGEIPSAVGASNYHYIKTRFTR